MSKKTNTWVDAVIQSLEDQMQRSCWKPAADIYRTESGWLVKLDVAGVQANDIKTSISGKKLYVSGVRREHSVTQGMMHHQLEINYFSFERVLELPEDIELAVINLELDLGMLFISIEVQH